MRQRKAKDLPRRLQECEHLMVKDPDPKMWASYFNHENEGRKLYVEIGCGKGNFIIKKALDNPDCDFVAIEGQETVILRAMEKVMLLEADGKNLDNLKFMSAFVEDARDLFAEGSVAGIYLNFSDPWPKARHAKRRLTYRGRLENYSFVLEDDGFIEFKTDNDALYDFSLEEIEESKYHIVEQTRDLHSSEYESRLTMTEYEAKFSSNGKNINYVKIKL